MAQSKPPFTIPSSAKVTGSRWEERQFPPGVSDGLKSTWPSSPYRPSSSRQYQIKIAQDWAERDGSAKPGNHPFYMYPAAKHDLLTKAKSRHELLPSDHA